ncbi:Protein-L-isoaspartate O-methyltransferase [Streptomyces sp. enrichment culture]
MNARQDQTQSPPARLHPHTGNGVRRARRRDFVPDVIRVHRSQRWRRVDRRKNAGEWGKAVHSGSVVVFDVDDGKDAGPGLLTGIVATEEDVAARLAALAPAPGMSIAEIGTDSGWTAALLDHRLRGGRVVTLADTGRLATIARDQVAPFPRIRVTHEADVLQAAGPFHGLLSHRAVCRIPWEWISAVRPGGRVCVPVRTRLGGPSTLLVLTVARDGQSATGRFREGPVLQTLWLRSHRPGGATPVAPQDSPRLSQDLPLVQAPLAQAARLFAGLLRPDLHLQVVRGDAFLEGRVADRLRLHDQHRSRAVVLIQPRHTYEWGPRSLGTYLVDALAQWHTAGQPTAGHLGLTVTPARHTLWLGSPDGPSWPLPHLRTPAGEG